MQDRKRHSATAKHQANGGSAVLVESDYGDADGAPTYPRGTSKVRGDGSGDKVTTTGTSKVRGYGSEAPTHPTGTSKVR